MKYHAVLRQQGVVTAPQPECARAGSGERRPKRGAVWKGHLAGAVNCEHRCSQPATCHPAGGNGKINNLPHSPPTLPSVGWIHLWSIYTRSQKTKVAIDANGREQPLRAQSQVDMGKERIWRSQQEMCLLCPCPYRRVRSSRGEYTVLVTPGRSGR